MDKQYYVLETHKDKNISWRKGEIILLDPETALPYIDVIITPLYSAIKSGVYKPGETKITPKIVEDIQDIKEVLKPDATEPIAKKIIDSNDVVKPIPSKKKLLQNKLQAQILAKKAELAKQNN